MAWHRRRPSQRGIETTAEEWLACHGDHAYGLARERIHDAWRLGDYAGRDRWMRIRAALRRMVGR